MSIQRFAIIYLKTPVSWSVSNICFTQPFCSYWITWKAKWRELVLRWDVTLLWCLSIDKKVYWSVIYGYSPFNCWSEQDVQKDVQTKISSTNLCSVFVGHNSKIVRRKNAGMYSSVMVNKVVFFLSCKILYLYFKILQLHLTLKYLKTNELWFIAR